MIFELFETVTDFLATGGDVLKVIFIKSDQRSSYNLFILYIYSNGGAKPDAFILESLRFSFEKT